MSLDYITDEKVSCLSALLDAFFEVINEADFL